MEIKFNPAFRRLLTKYNLPEHLNFNFLIPKKVQRLLNQKIIVNEYGIGCENNWIPSLGINQEEQSIHEDNENHFHVDQYLDDPEEYNVFMLGVKALIELAKRFENEQITNVRLTYSFQSPEMAKAEAVGNNFDPDGHLISDRLSFHTRRNNQLVVDEMKFKNEYFAFMMIDI